MTTRVGPASTRRFFLRRAVERGDPRLGLVVGLLLSVACVFALAAGVFEPLELRALDFAFQRRAPIRESDKLLLVDIDDLSLRELPWPIPRESYAQAAVALNRLGAREIVFDVQFKTIIPPPGTFDEATGDYRLEPGEAALRAAIARAGNVTLPFSFDPESRVATGPNEVERVRVEAVVAKVAEAMDRTPGLSFADLRQAFLPAYDPRSQQRDLKVLQFAYWFRRCRAAIDAKSPPVAAEGAWGGVGRSHELFPTFYPFLENAAGVGCVAAQADPDGVMRRPWAVFRDGDRYYPYLGLQMAIRAMESPEERVETVVRPGAIDLRRIGRADGTVRGTVSIPVDREQRVLVNWAGNAARRRGREQEYFAHVPFLKVKEFYQKRYELLDDNVRRTLGQLSEEEKDTVDARKYLALSDRFKQALRGAVDIPAADVRALEEKLDRAREKMVGAFREFVAYIDERLPTMTAPRVKADSVRKRAKWIEQIESITAPDDLERQLRPLIEGKICLIGSAFEASGDLHAIPLGSATPGMDVLANVANMALTGQTIRRVPAWVNVLALMAVGLLVSIAVTRWSATGSSIATVGIAAASGGLFWVLFTGPAVLIAVAGPVGTALLTFAGVTAYKELVTERSRRKLQRELEKNTSPALVKILMEHPEFLSRPRKMIGTFFFSDVKSFTSITEKMDAEVLFPFINRYLDRVTQALIGHEAFVDKYIGDGIMALFGIPVPNPNHAANACKAALDCQGVLKGLNAEFALEGLPEVKMRIGIHSGEVRAGNVGSLSRSNYTVLGDNVNLAARLEGANKEYDTSIMISESTWDLVSGRFAARELDLIRVVGKRKPVRIFELLAPAGGPLPVDPAFLEAYGAALAAFKDRRWAEAIEAFQKALALKPGDKPSLTYVERAKVFQRMPPPPDWEGVFELTSK